MTKNDFLKKMQNSNEELRFKFVAYCNTYANEIEDLSELIKEMDSSLSLDLWCKLKYSMTLNEFINDCEDDDEAYDLIVDDFIEELKDMSDYYDDNYKEYYDDSNMTDLNFKIVKVDGKNLFVLDDPTKDLILVGCNNDQYTIDDSKLSKYINYINIDFLLRDPQNKNLNSFLGTSTVFMQIDGIKGTNQLIYVFK